MKRFAVHGYFSAEDIDDAFRRLSEHFAALAEGSDSLGEFDGEPRHFEIYPIGDDLVSER